MMRSTFATTILAFLVLLLVAAPFSGAAPKSKGGMGMKHARFLRQAKSSPNKILDLKASSDFDDLTASPRNYSISLLLTAVDSGVSCGPCLAFQPSYENLAKGFAKVKGGAPDRHMFASLEFKNGREVFQKVSST